MELCYLGSRRAVWGASWGCFWAAGLSLELMGGMHDVVNARCGF